MKRKGLEKFLFEQTIEQLEIDIKKAHYNKEVLTLRPGANSLVEFLERRIYTLESQLAELILLSDLESDDE